MNPKPSQLDCRSYFVSDLSVSANPEHDPDKPIELKFIDLHAESHTDELQAGGLPRTWVVSLSIRMNAPVERNLPYSFAIDLVGHFSIESDEIADQEAQRLVEVNGSSVLFSAARQILLTAMHNGPFTPIALPTVTFNAPENNKEAVTP